MLAMLGFCPQQDRVVGVTGGQPAVVMGTAWPASACAAVTLRLYITCVENTANTAKTHDKVDATAGCAKPCAPAAA